MLNWTHAQISINQSINQSISQSRTPAASCSTLWNTRGNVDCLPTTLHVSELHSFLPATQLLNFFPLQHYLLLDIRQRHHNSSLKGYTGVLTEIWSWWIRWKLQRQKWNGIGAGKAQEKWIQKDIRESEKRGPDAPKRGLSEGGLFRTMKWTRTEMIDQWEPERQRSVWIWWFVRGRNEGNRQLRSRKVVETEQEMDQRMSDCRPRTMRGVSRYWKADVRSIV